MLRSLNWTLLFLSVTCNVFDVTLRDNFQFQSDFIDTEKYHSSDNGKMSKLPINLDYG